MTSWTSGVCRRARSCGDREEEGAGLAWLWTDLASLPLVHLLLQSVHALSPLIEPDTQESRLAR